MSEQTFQSGDDAHKAFNMISTGGRRVRYLRTFRQYTRITSGGDMSDREKQSDELKAREVAFNKLVLAAGIYFTRCFSSMPEELIEAMERAVERGALFVCQIETMRP